MKNVIIKTNVIGHLKMLWPIIFINSLVIIFFIYVEADVKLILYLFLPYFVIFILPTLCLHINHYNHIHDITYEIGNDQIIKNKKGEILIFDIDTIIEVEFFMTRSKLSHTPNSLLFSDYYYAVLRLDNGEKIVMSSIYSNNLYEILLQEFDVSKIKQTAVFFPIINT